ncbi:glucose dehydrogenase [Gordonia sp. TBRC 11910]|uniref:Glucose dehydrogenase n=1 Tax=Gordonia asplenii TaxID=2725283 RepID=A0A848KQU8_9ACTN|nr:PQQ-dependent sugar dehydrogenase [Gordonia asplenii]NMO01364.1 glucose dehydrogenase [Gordonia asplenii]
MESGRSRGYRFALLTVLVAALLAATACTDFSVQDRQAQAGQFSSEPPMVPVRTSTTPPSTETESPPPPGPCVDPDPNVITTCLASTGDLVPGDADGAVTVVAERTTGKIITAKRYSEHKVVASFSVDGSGDGGLIAFAKSPTYSQDQLIYALITTPSDNRVVRIAPGDVAKPILVGIPKGPTGNMGAMFFNSPTELIVATGNAGDPAAADNPASLAGKLLSITSLTSGGNVAPKILASGLGSNVSLCPSLSTSNLYLADQTATEDRLSVVSKAGLKPLWTWPDKPQIAGCAATNNAIYVTTTRTKHIEALNEPTQSKPTVQKPTVVLKDQYGALGRITGLANGMLQFATVNRESGKPVSTDDRVVRFLAPTPQEDKR